MSDGVSIAVTNTVKCVKWAVRLGSSIAGLDN